jgi:uncharacterized protein (UPF0332 family)
MSRFRDEIKMNVEEAITYLQAAKEHLQTGQYEAAVSSASDSGLHTARALLLDEGIERGKHGDIITLILDIFVNGRRLTKEQGAELSWLFALGSAENRELSRSVTSEEAHRAVEIAASFFEAAKVILEG